MILAHVVRVRSIRNVVEDNGVIRGAILIFETGAALMITAATVGLKASKALKDPVNRK